MKSIIFMRHSYAEDGFDKADFDRRLLKKGYEKIDLQVEQFKAQNNSRIDFVVCSAAVRTSETCQYFLDKLGVNIPVKYEQWIYEDYLSAEFIDYVQALDNQYNSLLFIGHNPNISQIATRMSYNGMFGFKPGGILKLDFNADAWKLIKTQSGNLDYYLA
ncbi:MAG: histidine phosphatase family protein [Bacteroidales bacterium]|nr:histidine phosphatase family protein [Bacteroidales bacterium]